MNECPRALDRLVAQIKACRRCIEDPSGQPLPHEPRPVLRVSSTARLAIAGQAPGTRVHASGKPFTDPSGDRLRLWLNVTSDEFYDQRRVAIIPMGFCFPGLDAKGGDRPPRKECAPMWRKPLFELLPRLTLVLLVGQYAQRWHLGHKHSLTETVADWRAYLHAPQSPDGPRYCPLPHPSWRNNSWLKKHPWFEEELLPMLRQEVRASLDEDR